MSAPRLIPRGTVFTPDDITFWAGKGEGRTLADALAEADLLVSTPHAGSAMPEEVREFVVEDYTERLQLDYTDCTTAPICRAWAATDPRIIYVENPHPRLIRDPNRKKPADVAATLREAIERVREAGIGNRVDLTGVDAIRPVSFSFRPVLVTPSTGAELDRLTETFAAVAANGLEVYERTRDELRERMLARSLSDPSSPRAVWRLSFHDTMNTTTTVDGAVNVAREAKDRLPAVVALSNRGDAEGRPRDADPIITMPTDQVQALALAHRRAFRVAEASDVQLNQPYLGSQEIIDSGARFDEVRAEADAVGVRLGAVQAEFLREFLLGDAATAELHAPGTLWPAVDEAHSARIAAECRVAWNEFRDLLD